MKVTKLPIALLLLTLLTATTIAQQKRQTPAKPQPKAPVAQAPAPTFDTLVPAESYIFYGEVRGVGQFVRSGSANDVLEPILKLAGPPKEFKNLVKWLNAHAEELMTSRLLVAASPLAKGAPEVVIAIEFASAEEATKFIKPLNEFLPTVLPPKAVDPSTQSKDDKTNAEAAEPDYHLQQAGALILLTPKPLALKKLRPAGSKALTEDPNFRTARNRFSSEPLFVFVDFKLMERQSEERRKEAEAEQVRREKAEAEPAATKPEQPSEPEPMQEEKEILQAEQAALATATASVEEDKERTGPDQVWLALSTIGSAFFRAESKWPDALAVALAPENDSFDLRALLVNQPGEKSDAVPFVPMLIPGPALLPEAPNVLPADTELFATMSLDWQQIYSAMSRPPVETWYVPEGNVQTQVQVSNESPFAAIEQKLKINVKNDLLPLLGSEIALRLPLTNMDIFGLPRGPAPASDANVNSTTQQPSTTAAPVLLISLKDREGMRALLPKIVESFGLKGASSFAQTERKEDTELVSYANLFAYAFIGNFLVLSTDVATTRHVVDSYLKQETLAGDSQFRNHTRWQPRPSHGQLYISPALMESYKTWAENPSTRLNDQTRAFLTRLSAVAQPITYSLSNDGLGPFHEVHIPKNLVLMAVAGISGEANPPTTFRNEGITMGLMYAIAHSEEQYKKEKGAGSYGTLEQLIEAKMISKDMIDSSGYRFELISSGDKFEITAVPVEYGKTGNMSYFIDHTKLLRGADRSGASATSSDPRIN